MAFTKLRRRPDLHTVRPLAVVLHLRTLIAADKLIYCLPYWAVLFNYYYSTAKADSH